MGTPSRYILLMALFVPGRAEVDLSEDCSPVFEVDGGLTTADENHAHVAIGHLGTGHTGQLGVGQPDVLRPGTCNKDTKGGDMRALGVTLAAAFAGALAGLTFLSVCLMRLRRFLHKYGTLQCALWRKEDRQVPGIVMFRADVIEWYPRRFLVLNLKWSFPRGLLEIRGHRQGVLPGTMVVEFLGDGVECEVVLRTAQFVGFASWIDSAPSAEEPVDF